MTDAQQARSSTEDEPPKGPADFEVAMQFTGFGWFNVFILALCVPMSMASMFTASAISFAAPMAECDLSITMIQKGIMFGLPFAGMMCTACIWGVVSDFYGRRHVIIVTYLLDFIFGIATAASQSTTTLLIFRFFNGCALSAASAIMFSYLSEVSRKKYRTLMFLYIGSLLALSMVILPILAIYIMREDWEFDIGSLKFYRWQIFLLICTIPTLVALLAMIPLPESPKFLMSQGRNDKALAVFKRIYTMNTRKPKEEYPITELIDEVALRNENDVLLHRWRARRRRLMAIMQPPLRGFALIFFVLNFHLMLGLNTYQWFPQLILSLEELQRRDNVATANLCDVIAFSYKQNQNTIVNTGCDEPKSPDYSGNVLGALINVVAFVVALLILKKVRVKYMLNCNLLICSISWSCLYFVNTKIGFILVACVFFCNSSVASMLMVSVCVNIFPTTVRGSVVSLILVAGQIGTVVGHILFPISMGMGCIAPLALISGSMLISFVMSIFVPHTDNVQTY